MIEFNIPPFVGEEIDNIKKAMGNKKICGDGPFTKKCDEWLEENTGSPKALLTTSCTHAIEMATLLADIKPGDEVIMPSYTFVSTANPFVLRGAKIRFVDIRQDTLNIDENLVERAITNKTKAIVPVHYAGVSCEMNKILKIAENNNLMVIEDAAQGLMSKYENRALGSMGTFGCFSFHETKNYAMGEGGALLINEGKYSEKAEVVREKGTDRSKFLRGQVDKYSWVDKGSSYLPSDINAAFLYAQLEKAELINNNRISTWQTYYDELKSLEKEGQLELPNIPKNCTHNAHMFYLKLKNMQKRSEFISFMRERGVSCPFHYVPLHSSQAGKIFGEFVGEDKYTTKESQRLVRLPLYYNMKLEDIEKVIQEIKRFFG